MDAVNKHLLEVLNASRDANPGYNDIAFGDTSSIASDNL
jgi:hypothetical protein